MPYIDEEFLLLSRTGRIGPRTNARLGQPRTREEQARRELAAQHGSAMRRARRTRRVRTRRRFGLGSAVASVIAGLRGQ